jgi:hypothetical protein
MSGKIMTTGKKREQVMNTTKTNLTSVIAVLFTLILGQEASADRRIFGYTYPYQTLPQGSRELEHYLDMGFNDWDDESTPEPEDEWTAVDWKHQLEFEYGITDHLDFGFYNVFSQKPYGSLGYDGFKLRSRLRFKEQGELLFDPAIYFEVGYFGEEIKLEEMLILAKRLGRIEIAFNAKVEQEFKIASGKWEHEFLPLLGIGYHFNNNFAVSLEYYGKLKIEDGKVEYYINYLGPAFSVSGGAFFWTLAIQPQLGSRKSKAAVQVRSLFGVIF